MALLKIKLLQVASLQEVRSREITLEVLMVEFEKGSRMLKKST